MKYIIMCGGRYDGWEIPRQMLEIRGEPVVARTIRLLRENGAEDIAISTQDERFKQFGVPLLSHENNFIGYKGGTGSWVEGFYPTNGPACYILGDVVFSPEAIRTIVTVPVVSIQFFASSPPFSDKYIKPYAEPFAFKVMDQQRFRAAIDFVMANEGTGLFHRRPIAWELWQVINGEDVNHINFKNYIAINDYTCDIDKKEDARKIEEVLYDHDSCLPGKRVVCKRFPGTESG